MVGCAVLFGGCAVLVGGCASLTEGNEAIIRVQAAQDPIKAARLTLHGIKAMDGGDVDRAAAKFASAIAADQAYGPAHNNLGLLHFDQGNLYQALLAFEQAMELMPHDPAVYYNLGLTLESAGKVYEAMDLYWQAVEMDSVNPFYLGNLVRLRIRLGEDGPDLKTQLQDLVLIETRPEWRRWADRQLALTRNNSLDRGPETPEFDALADRDSTDDKPRLKSVIDLTPQQPNSKQGKTVEPPEEVEAVPLQGPRVETIPIPLRDSGSLEELPPSIHVKPRRNELRDYLK